MANVQSCNRTLIPTTAANLQQAVKTGSKHFIFLKIIRRSWLIVTRLLLVHLWRKTVFVDVFHVHTLGTQITHDALQEAGGPASV